MVRASESQQPADVMEGVKVRKRKTRVGCWSREEVAAKLQAAETEWKTRVKTEGSAYSEAQKARLRKRICRLKSALAGKTRLGGNIAPRDPSRSREERRKELKRQKEAARRADPQNSALSSSAYQQKKQGPPALVKKGLPGVRWKQCLCCRGRGHTVAECQMNAAAAKETICYNCGDKDHSLRACPQPRQPDGSLPFSTCFICGETGHISAKCPHNSTGIFPKGGGCHMCSSLYHKMQDCPVYKMRLDGKRKKKLQQELSVEDNDQLWDSDEGK